MFNFRFGIKYRVSIRFGFGFFKYLFYNRILVLLVLSYIKLKLLSSLGRFSVISRFLVDVSRNFRLVDSSGFFRF